MPVSFDQHTILLVEDETFSRMMVGQMLERLGFARVLLAENGYQAMDILRQEPITVVLTDFRMPGMHGLQLLKMIRTGKTAAARNLPCALLTSHAERHLVGLAIVLDADTFLAKPVSSETLSKHLNRCFQYRFEPLEIGAYDSVEVDDAAPHLYVQLPVDEAPAAPPVAPQSAAPAPPQAAPAPTARAETPPSPTPGPSAKTPEAPAPTAKAPEPKPAARGGAPAKPVAQPKKPLKAKQVPVSEVPENAVLARDLIGSGGTLLLAAGTRFKSRYAKRLEELHEGDVEHVWIVDE